MAMQQLQNQHNMFSLGDPLPNLSHTGERLGTSEVHLVLGAGGFLTPPGALVVPLVHQRTVAPGIVTNIPSLGHSKSPTDRVSVTQSSHICRS